MPSKLPNKKITRNAVKCLQCNSIIDSRYRHHFVTCQCRAIMIDGGLEYLKRSINRGAKWVELSTFEEKETEKDSLNNAPVRE